MGKMGGENPAGNPAVSLSILSDAVVEIHRERPAGSSGRVGHRGPAGGHSRQVLAKSATQSTSASDQGGLALQISCDRHRRALSPGTVLAPPFSGTFSPPSRSFARFSPHVR